MRRGFVVVVIVVVVSVLVEMLVLRFDLLERREREYLVEIG